MINIIVFTPEEADGCSWYRAFGVLGHLPNIQLHKANTVTWATFAGMDIAFFQRPYTRKHLAVVELAKSMGCKIWIDYDDLLTQIPRSNPSHEAYKDTCITTILRAADAITVSTHTLAGEIGHYVSGTKIKVIPNAYNDYVLSTKYERAPFDKTLIMWRGTNSHQGDLQSYAAQIDAAVDQHADSEFAFVGYDPWMIKIAKNVVVHKSMDLFTYFKVLVQSGPDILIVPLEDNTFNRCKSNIAQLETARCGATVVGPSWLEWDRELTHMVYYDQCSSLSAAIQQAKEERAELSDDDLKAKWENGLDRNRLSKVNELRTEVINDLQ